jgi:hypothetical protein
MLALICSWEGTLLSDFFSDRTTLLYAHETTLQFTT